MRGGAALLAVVFSILARTADALKVRSEFGYLEAVAQLCSLNPHHSLCARVDVLDNPTTTSPLTTQKVELTTTTIPLAATAAVNKPRKHRKRTRNLLNSFEREVVTTAAPSSPFPSPSEDDLEAEFNAMLAREVRDFSGIALLTEEVVRERRNRQRVSTTPEATTSRVSTTTSPFTTTSVTTTTTPQPTTSPLKTEVVATTSAPLRGIPSIPLLVSMAVLKGAGRRPHARRNIVEAESGRPRSVVINPSSSSLPPRLPPVITTPSTTPSLWEWMNDASEREGYLFEENEEKRKEIFKRRWMKALKDRKKKQRRAHASRTLLQEVGLPLPSPRRANRVPFFLRTLRSTSPSTTTPRPSPRPRYSGVRRFSWDDPMLAYGRQPTPLNGWNFPREAPETRKTGEPLRGISPFRNQVLADPERNGTLATLGDVAGVGFGFGIPIPDNDPVSVAARIGVSLGGSGLAGDLPQNPIFPPQGERRSFNDYDGNKSSIVPGRWAKIQQAIQEGRIRPPPIYRQPNSIANVNSALGVGYG